MVLGVVNKWAHLDCGSKSLLPGQCQLCAASGQPWRISTIADTCISNPACVAFIVDEAAPCAYLMTFAEGQSSSVPFSKQYGDLGYCLNDRGAGCTGKALYLNRSGNYTVGDLAGEQAPLLSSAPAGLVVHLLHSIQNCNTYVCHMHCTNNHLLLGRSM